MTTDNMPWIMWNPDKVPTDNMPPHWRAINLVGLDDIWHPAIERYAEAYARAYAEQRVNDVRRIWQLQATDAEQQTAELRAEVERLKGQIRAFARDAISSRPEQS